MQLADWIVHHSWAQVCIPSPFIFRTQSAFPLKRLRLRPQWFSFSPQEYVSVWSMFLGVVCVCPLWECVRASMHMLMCATEAGRATTNAVCSRAYECPLWTHPAPEPPNHPPPPRHLMPVWALHMKRNDHICKRTCTKMYMHWYDPAVMWQAWDLGLDYGVRRPQRVGKPGPNWVPLTGPWPGAICPHKSRKL